MVQTRSAHKDGSPDTNLPYRKRRADDESTPSGSAKKSKRGTPRPKLPIRLPTQDEIVVGVPGVPSDGLDDDRQEEGDLSVYETPATHDGGSVYATPATHFTKKTIMAGGVETPTQQPSRKGAKKIKSEAVVVIDNKAAPSTGKRIRFTSEEPVDALGEVEEARKIPSSGAPLEDIEDDGDESDDAPEEVTTAAALQLSREAQSAAGKAKQAQNEAERSKRRKKDQTLRRQAQSMKDREKARQAKADAKAEDEDDSDVEDIDVQRDVLEDLGIVEPLMRKLPKYLPQELLDAAPAVRPLSPPPTTQPSLITSSQTNRLALLDAKHPRDRTKGPVSVRVLQDLSTYNYMAPKSQPKRNSQREVKERWMKGREGRIGQMRGVVGSGKVERRSLSSGGKGFLRG